MIPVRSDTGKALVEAIGQLLREGTRLVNLGPRATELERSNFACKKDEVLQGIVIEAGQPAGSSPETPYAGFDDRGSEA
ncbi:hypothetical protein IDVR_27050 [Intrasporangium sp. DVR]